MKQDQNKKAAEKELKEIVSHADATLVGFVELGASFGLALDYSLDSLDEVEKLLVTFKGRPEFGKLKADAWLYVGECICRSLKGKWAVSEDLQYYRRHYMLPIVKGFSRFNDEYCPMQEIDRFLESGKKSFFKNTIQMMQTGTYRYD